MDPFRKVQNGEPFVPSAEASNAAIDAARAERARRADVGRTPIRRTHEPEVVSVLNATESSDWTMWQPVLVGYTDDAIAPRAVSFAAHPYFPGYDLDHDDYHTAYPVLGITQEPIAAGRAGRVCVSGPTLALMQKAPTGWTNQAGWDCVHVAKSGSRWTLRNGPGGDGRLLKIVDVSNLYEDGTYDDQYLVWIDLCEVPERVWFLNNTGASVPPHSVLARNQLGVAALPSSNPTYYLAAGQDLIASPGWYVAKNAYGLGYRFGERPVKVHYALDALPAIGSMMGPAGGQLTAWPELPGWKVTATDWYKAGQPYLAWVVKESRSFWAKRSGGATYACTTGGAAVYDGGTYGGVVYPTVKAPYTHPEIYAPGTTAARELNIQVGQVFPCDVVDSQGRLVASPVCLDDPIGTVKIWTTSDDPPPGWRDYSALEGMFPVGYAAGDSDFDPLGNTGGAKTHTHPVGGAMGSTGTAYGAASHLPPYRVVRFLERYQ
jgi:hypothetical protein